ncbi:MAG: nitroreductase/quinone reductase family protein [Acidimicrobiales bacterium]
MSLSTSLELHQFAYLTTRGRATGRPHRIEIWFVVIDGAVWVNSGGGETSDWVRNLMAHADLTLEIGSHSWPARGTLRPDLDDHPARKGLAARYQGWKPGTPLSAWATGSLLVEIRAVGR